jgi:hypothetical protein
MSPFRRLYSLLLISILSTPLAQPALAQTAGLTRADDPVAHFGQWKRTIEADLIAGRFDDLDRMADQYRRDKTRLPGGEWVLHKFYAALDAPQLTDKDSMEHIARLEAWIKQRPESITARVALATSLHRWAWVARGNGMADTVTATGWQLFGERIMRSQQVLLDAEKLHTMCPQWYSEMMTVGLAQSWDARQMQDTFERGIQFEPDYYYLYKQYANYLLPKWDGKPGDESAFAKTSADRLGGDAGDTLYFEIATVLISRSNGNFPVHELNWERIQSGYKALCVQYGGDSVRHNELAYMAYKFKDTTVARRQFERIGDNWSKSVWRERAFFDRARDWSHGVQAGNF